MLNDCIAANDQILNPLVFEKTQEIAEVGVDEHLNHVCQLLHKTQRRGINCR